MARWTASAKWAAGPALDGQRDMPLALRLSEGLGLSFAVLDIVGEHFSYVRSSPTFVGEDCVVAK